MTTKIPSELSKRLQKAQAAWDNELKVLKTSVLTFEAFYNVQKRKEAAAASSSHCGSHLNVEQQKLLEGVKNLQRDVRSLRQEHGSHLTRIDADLLGLYDWTREKVASLRSL
ncbi:unnamed protein product [Phytophthora fragariaefolia]|uniref:Unnamed protein product n=1 Tax=Phytophthora fragariaefolia TaxID=1490495 RepID=A0A9W6X728_9STRA|nr:unnamed protein product [Phytophthora fragariaefolia]